MKAVVVLEERFAVGDLCSRCCMEFVSTTKHYHGFFIGSLFLVLHGLPGNCLTCHISFVKNVIQWPFAVSSAIVHASHQVDLLLACRKPRLSASHRPTSCGQRLLAGIASPEK